MSKAFTREDDDAPEPAVRPRPAAKLPPGVKNYLTPDGHRRLLAELQALTQARTPTAEASEADARIRELQAVLNSAVVTPPPPPGEARIRFGAWVMVRDRAGETTTYRIVGVEETDVDRGWISWLSPLAKALLNSRPGERARLRLPAGEMELEVVSVRYGTAGDGEGG